MVQEFETITDGRIIHDRVGLGRELVRLGPTRLFAAMQVVRNSYDSNEGVDILDKKLVEGGLIDSGNFEQLGGLMFGYSSDKDQWNQILPKPEESAPKEIK